MRNKKIIVTSLLALLVLACQPAKQDQGLIRSADEQHGDIGVNEAEQTLSHTQHPDAQWFPEAGLGLFIHWGLSSVKEMSLSWPIRPGRPLAKEPINDPDEVARIIREKDYNLTGEKLITPNEYWAMIEDFSAANYDPDKWMKAAKEAGFKYTVLTTKHHEGFALWPSEFGDFNTKNHLNGRDLVGEFVAAAKKHGLKVGLYFSGGDWWAEKQYKDFMYYKVPRVNPQFPALDVNLNPRPEVEPDPEELNRYHNELRTLIRGQITELLSRYGTIDILWFDGSPKLPEPAEQTFSIAEIRALQPGIVINPRFHGKGDFKTHEGRIKTTVPESEWSEFCYTWGDSWAYTANPFKANGHVFAEYAKARSLNMNLLLGVGPDRLGELSEQSYNNMTALKVWHDTNFEAVSGNVSALPESETSNVIATSQGSTRYLFITPEFEGGKLVQHMLPAKNMQLELTTDKKVQSVSLLGNDDFDLNYAFDDGKLTVNIPATLRSKEVQTVKVVLQ